MCELPCTHKINVIPHTCALFFCLRSWKNNNFRFSCCRTFSGCRTIYLVFHSDSKMQTVVFLSILILSVTLHSATADTVDIQWVSNEDVYTFRAAESTGCANLTMFIQNETEFDVTGYNCTAVTSYTIALFGWAAFYSNLVCLFICTSFSSNSLSSTLKTVELFLNLTWQNDDYVSSNSLEHHKFRVSTNLVADCSLTVHHTGIATTTLSSTTKFLESMKSRLLVKIATDILWPALRHRIGQSPGLPSPVILFIWNTLSSECALHNIVKQ